MINPDIIEISMSLKKAKSIEEFKSSRGSRILNKPYWVRLEDGTMWFDFIKASTDAQDLNESIEGGRVYLLKR